MRRSRNLPEQQSRRAKILHCHSFKSSTFLLTRRLPQLVAGTSFKKKNQENTALRILQLYNHYNCTFTVEIAAPTAEGFKDLKARLEAIQSVFGSRAGQHGARPPSYEGAQEPRAIERMQRQNGMVENRDIFRTYQIDIQTNPVNGEDTLANVYSIQAPFESYQIHKHGSSSTMAK
jgi:hypothetical protein